MSSTPKLPYFVSPEFDNSMTADADLSTYTYRLLKATSTGVDLCGAGGDSIGILYNAPTSGQYAEVVIEAELATGVAAAAISATGLPLKPAANGKLTPASSGDQCVGISRSTASGDGVLVAFFPSKFQAA